MRAATDADGGSARARRGRAPTEADPADADRRRDAPAPTWLERGACALFFAWVFLLCVFPLRSMDVWWHLRAGQLIAERGELPANDWFTYTSADRPWIDLHWGYQLGLAGLHAVAGTDGLVLAKAALAALALALLWRAAGPRLSVAAKAACLAPAAVVLAGRSFVRPEMLSFPLLAACFWLVAASRRRPRLLLLYPVVQLVWTNTHALFVLGLGVGAAALADRVLRVRAGGRFGLAPPEPGAPARRWALALALGAAAAFANPWLADGALFPLQLYRKLSVDADLYAVIREFQPPLAFARAFGFGAGYLPALALLWLATAASFAWLARERRWSPERVLVFAAFSHLAWQAQRNAAVFAVAAGAVLCANVADALELRARRRGVAATPRARPRLAPAALALVALLAIEAVRDGTFGRWHGDGRTLALAPPEGWYLHDAARFAGRDGMPRRAYVSHLGQAAVYLYHNGPERKVFLDGRLEVPSRGTFVLYRTIAELVARSDPAFEPLLCPDGGELPALVLDRAGSHPLIAGLLGLPHRWRLVHTDAAGVVFVPLEVAERLEPVPPAPASRPR